MIVLKYRLADLSVLPSTLVNEIEYGTTFALYHDREECIPLPSQGPQWFKWEMDGQLLVMRVEDEFLEVGCFFEKVLTSFLYNLLDFGCLELVSIDVSGCSNLHQFRTVYRKPLRLTQPFREGVLLGTVLKPYYHLTLAEKVRLTAQFTDVGLSFVKEDETYLVPKTQLLEEAVAIQGSIKGRGAYVPNVTHCVWDHRFIERLVLCGVDIVMVDYLVAGFRSVYELKREFPELGIWGHRIGYCTLDRFVSLEALGTLAALAGINFVHVGTPVNARSMDEKAQAVSAMRRIDQGLLPVFTKTTPEIVPGLIRALEGHAVLMACGYFRDSSGRGIDWQRVQDWIAVAQNAARS